MLLYRVREGDALDKIASQFGATVRDISRVNELSELTTVPGQALLIPSDERFGVESYVVKQGDTAQTIMARYGITQADLAAWNGLKPNEALTVGTRLYIPVRRPTKRTIEVNGYLLPTGTSSDAQIVQDVSNSTYICSFSYQARADGSLDAPKDAQALAAMKQYKIRPLMTITNFDGNQFSTSLAHTILANASIRKRLIDQALATCSQKGFGGVNIDFEHMQPSDRQPYNGFIRELRDAAHAKNLSVSIAMGPKTGDNPNQSWMGAFDYKTLGQEVDIVMLMTYEWGWVGGPPMTNILLHCFRRYLLAGVATL